MIHFLLGFFVLVNVRLLLKTVYLQLILPSKNTHVLIYGVGGLGIITRNLLVNSNTNTYKIVGFVDDHPSKQGKKVEGIRVYAPKEALSASFLKAKKVEQVVIAIQNIAANKKRDIANHCLSLDVNVRYASSADSWLHDTDAAFKIKDVRIEDLLGRDAIHLNCQNIEKGIHEKTILITGAAGSIGSEIVRQVLPFQPSRVILIDQAETPLNDLLLECSEFVSKGVVRSYVCDVTNRTHLNRVFEATKPDLVFHAAAYKHVPMMEDNPYEAIRTNVGGTKAVADLAVQHRVGKVVMISTDKAVNPTNIMGASKRASEMYCRSLGKKSPDTDFVVTRFGNVLGSNGSVIPLFRRQIEAGGPLTVTHKEVTRFFMTIPEACQLVLEAAFMGREGQIFVFDMGESVKIYDLAKKMIKISGLTLGKEIEIKISGLRKGEKLYEELLANSENTMPTHHDKIMIGKVPDYDTEQLLLCIEKLLGELENLCDTEIYQRLVGIVPEFTPTDIPAFKRNA